jgi:hypothetical protein
MMYRVTRKETYVAWVSATDEEHAEQMVADELGSTHSVWMSDPDDTEIVIELIREEEC